MIAILVKAYLILTLGIVGAASSVFFIKKSGLQPASLAASRLLLCVLVLAPMFFIELRRRGGVMSGRQLLCVLPGAVLLTTHFVTWFYGVRQTSASLSTLMVNLSPVVTPIFMWILFRDRLTRGEIIGSLIAMSGVFVLASFAEGDGISTLSGVLWCCGSMVLCVGYLVAGRRLGRGMGFFTYMVPMYLVAGLLSTGVAVMLGETLPPLNRHEVMMAFGAAIFPTVIGHTALNWSMMHLRTQTVSIANLGQFVFVAILAIPILHELPPPVLAPASVLIVGGAVMVIRSAPSLKSVSAA
jgi:drug/metabolite transporter (DMT)-like permease